MLKIRRQLNRIASYVRADPVELSNRMTYLNKSLSPQDVQSLEAEINKFIFDTYGLDVDACKAWRKAIAIYVGRSELDPVITAIYADPCKWLYTNFGKLKGKSSAKPAWHGYSLAFAIGVRNLDAHLDDKVSVLIEIAKLINWDIMIQNKFVVFFETLRQEDVLQLVLEKGINADLTSKLVNFYYQCDLWFRASMAYLNRLE